MQLASEVLSLSSCFHMNPVYCPNKANEMESSDVHKWTRQKQRFKVTPGGKEEKRQVFHNKTL